MCVCVCVCVYSFDLKAHSAGTLEYTDCISALE